MEFITSYQSYINPESFQDQPENQSFPEFSTNFLELLIQSIKSQFKAQRIQLIEKQFRVSTNIQNHDTLKDIPMNILLSAVLVSPFESYEYMVDFFINFETFSIKINSSLLENGMLLNLRKEGLIQSIFNFCLNFNSRCSNTSIKLSPLEGIIKTTSMNHFRKNQFLSLIACKSEFCDYLRNQMSILTEMWNDHIIHKILALSNMNPPRETASRKHQLIHETPFNSHFERINNKINTISTIVLNSHIEYPFMTEQIAPDSRNKESGNQSIIRFFDPVREDKKKKNQALIPNIHFSNFQNKKTDFELDLEKCLKYYTNSMDKQYLRDIMVKKEDIERFKLDHLKCIGTYIYPPKILTDITLHKIESERFLENGGYAEIYHIVGKVSRINQKPNRIETMSLVKKVAISHKLWHEKAIIRRIGKHNCLFIQKYYSPVDEEYQARDENNGDKECLYMDYCSKRSLNAYLSHYRGLISLKLKVFFIYQVTIGLRFLRDKNIVHLDIKPENILMRVYRNPAWLVLRLIDFGESYCHLELVENSKNSDHTVRRGYTIPYASPQLIRQDQTANNAYEGEGKKFVEKSDVYSLGVMILMMIFQINTTEIKRLGARLYLTDQYTQLYNVCAEKCRYFGYQPLMLCLLNLAFKCIKPQKYSRPLLDWVCVVLKESELLLEQLQF